MAVRRLRQPHHPACPSAIDREARMISMVPRPDNSASGMAGLVMELARPYRRWLVIILLAMLVETIAGLAGPWPLKVVIDYAVGHRSTPTWTVRLLGQAL